MAQQHSENRLQFQLPALGVKVVPFCGCRRSTAAIAAGLMGLVLSTSPVLAQADGSAPQQVAATSATLAESYTLGAGDRINIRILQVDQYSGESDVLIDGTVNLPVVGSISVEGLTLEQASNAISAAYSRILRRPVVTVSLVTTRPMRLGIAGEVNRPGSYTVPIENAQFPTLTQLLETAGGVRQAADLRRVQIRRTGAGGEQVVNVNLWQLLQTGDLRYDVSLRDGDTVFVPTNTQFDPFEAGQVAAASFAADESQPINIAVVGEVFRPGPYSVTGSARTGEAGLPGGAESASTSVPTVTRAIQLAGGIKPLADIRQVQIRRRTHAGTEQTLQVNLWELLQTGDVEQDIILQEGDTVFVPTATSLSPEEATAIASASFSPDTIQVNVVGEVETPGSVTVPPNTPLNQALLAAGGFNNRARRSEVQLLRLNPNGTVAQRSVSIDLAQGVNEASNPTLNNNDVIVVGRSDLASVSDTLDTALSPLTRVLTLFGLPFRLLGLFNF